MTATTTAPDEAARLVKATKAVQFGSTSARSGLGDFSRRLRNELKYRKGWVAKTLEQVRDKAALGCCSEVPGSGVVMPWVLQSVEEWHPNLTESLRARMYEQESFNQEELDMKFFLAAAVRILVEEHHVT